MTTIKLKLSEIKPYKNNPRKNDEAVKYVMESIKQCGYIAPIIIDENNEILAGHTRYKALKKLGYDEIECVVKTGLTEEQKRKYRILDNKTNEYAEWDVDLLNIEIKDLDFEGFDFGWDLEIDEGDDKEIIEDDFNEKNNTHLVSVGKIHFEPMGIYSNKKTLAEFTSECKVAIPNDTTNKQRAIDLLKEYNMDNADIIEITAQTIPTILQDVDYAVINGNYALSSGVTDKMLAKENQDSDIAQELANIVAVHESRQNEQWAKDLIEVLKSEKVKEFVESRFKGSVVVIGG